MRRFVIAFCLLALAACGSSGTSHGNPPPPPPATDGGNGTGDGGSSSSTGAVAVLNLDGSASQGPAPLTGSFDGSASYSLDDGAHITDYRWTFGDGSDPASGAKVTHTFQDPGTYAVTLTVTDSDGSSASSSVSIQVLESDPTATYMTAIIRLDGTPGHGTAPDTEKFDGTGSHSSNPDAALDGCRWSFGDGTTAKGCKVSHTFQEAGDYRVTLTAADTDGNTDDATLTVHVDAPATPEGVVAVARFDGTTGEGVAPDTEGFDGSGSHSRDPAATMKGCTWDFGDGSTATGCKASHTFVSAGSYTVTLTATDSNGDHASATLAVSVRAQPAGHVIWQQSFPSTTWVGTDWDHQVAAGWGPNLAMLDFDSGRVLWSHSFDATRGSDLYSTTFNPPLAILPGTSSIIAKRSIVGGPAPYSNVCRFESGGSELCESGYLEDEGATTSMAMAPSGDVAWGFHGFPPDNATVIQPDGNSWKVVLRQSDYDGTQLRDAVPVAGGDVVVAIDVPSGYSFDGQAMGPGHVMMRIDAAGKLVWWRQVPFAVLDLGASSAGTVVAVVVAADRFTFGDGNAQGTALVVVDAQGTSRFARQLSSSIADWAQLSVLPLGRVAVALDRPGCGGALVARYDLAGAEQWHKDFASYGCDVNVQGVAILPDSVVVSGQLKGTTDFGNGPLSPGGFVLRLGN